MTDTETSDVPMPSTIQRDDGSTIAYHFTPGKSPGVVFLGGFMSDMTGSKALALEEHCRNSGRAFLRFDYTGHGASSGQFEDGCIGDWADDALFALDHLTEGPQILIGSSMGGWVMLLIAMKRPERLAGLIGIAAAPDFTEDLLPNELTPQQKQLIEDHGVVYVDSPYGDEPTPYTKKLMEDGRKHLILRQRITVDVPVRLIQGMKDPDVPWQTSLNILNMIGSNDVEATFIKSGDHRLSEPADLERLTGVLEGLLGRIEP